MCKAEQVKLGVKYTIIVQEIEWICNVCGGANTSVQDIAERHSLIDPLLFECEVCCTNNEVPKSILEKC